MAGCAHAALSRRAAPEAAGVASRGGPVMTGTLEALAIEWVRLTEALALARQEVTDLATHEYEIRHDLEAVLTVGEAVAAGKYGHVAYVLPTAKGAARVIPAGLAEYDEQLTALGLVTEKVVRTKPGVRELRAAAAQLAAHGVPLSAVLMEPEPHPELTLVPNEGEG